MITPSTTSRFQEARMKKTFQVSFRMLITWLLWMIISPHYSLLTLLNWEEIVILYLLMKLIWIKTFLISKLLKAFRWTTSPLLVQEENHLICLYSQRVRMIKSNHQVTVFLIQLNKLNLKSRNHYFKIKL